MAQLLPGCTFLAAAARPSSATMQVHGDTGDPARDPDNYFEVEEGEQNPSYLAVDRSKQQQAPQDNYFEVEQGEQQQQQQQTPSYLAVDQSGKQQQQAADNYFEVEEAQPKTSYLAVDRSANQGDAGYVGFDGDGADDDDSSSDEEDFSIVPKHMQGNPA